MCPLKVQKGSTELFSNFFSNFFSSQSFNVLSSEALIKICLSCETAKDRTPSKCPLRMYCGYCFFLTRKLIPWRYRWVFSKLGKFCADFVIKVSFTRHFSELLRILGRLLVCVGVTVHFRLIGMVKSLCLWDGLINRYKLATFFVSGLFWVSSIDFSLVKKESLVFSWFWVSMEVFACWCLASWEEIPDKREMFEFERLVLFELDSMFGVFFFLMFFCWKRCLFWFRCWVLDEISGVSIDFCSWIACSERIKVLVLKEFDFWWCNFFFSNGSISFSLWRPCFLGQSSNTNLLLFFFNF